MRPAPIRVLRCRFRRDNDDGVGAGVLAEARTPVQVGARRVARARRSGRGAVTAPAAPAAPAALAAVRSMAAAVAWAVLAGSWPSAHEPTVVAALPPRRAPARWMLAVAVVGEGPGGVRRLASSEYRFSVELTLVGTGVAAWGVGEGPAAVRRWAWGVPVVWAEHPLVRPKPVAVRVARVAVRVARVAVRVARVELAAVRRWAWGAPVVWAQLRRARQLWLRRTAIRVAPAVRAAAPAVRAAAAAVRVWAAAVRVWAIAPRRRLALEPAAVRVAPAEALPGT
uniref:Uncharacterized protein n=1 Tax=Mycobacterium riyadhense TaxID=486698 RepID=A0A653ED44_9MYCO|nr:hypothetical protein BIN_B_00108 [Mycobacterium riyadhense]